MDEHVPFLVYQRKLYLNFCTSCGQKFDDTANFNTGILCMTCGFYYLEGVL